MKPKQVILVRKDLKMKSGKIGAQVAHASLAAILSVMNTYDDISNDFVKELRYNSTDPLGVWLHGKFTKVCLRVDSEEELLSFYNIAKRKGIICSLITDAGDTVFNGIPTKTTVAIGPDWENVIDEITGNLKLF